MKSLTITDNTGRTFRCPITEEALQELIAAAEQEVAQFTQTLATRGDLPRGQLAQERAEARARLATLQAALE